MDDRIIMAKWRLVPLFAATLALGALAPMAPAQWKGTGPYGGAAEIVRTSPQQSGMVIAGGHNGLLYISRNGGAYWTNVPFPGQFAGVLHALEIDPRSGETWYAGMESENQWTSGIYKTTDAGRNWELLPQTKGLGVWSIALAPNNPDVIAAGTTSGIWLSKNAGSAWSHITPEGDPELRPVVSLAFHPSDTNTIYAGTTHLPWRTTNGGKSWESVHEGMIDDSDVFSIQVDPLKPSRVFASACSGVYGSTNGAERWAKLTLPGGAFRTYLVAIDPKNDQVVFAGTTQGLMRSADGGRVWRAVSAEAVKAIAFDAFVPGRVFFASTTAGLMVSTDGGNTLRESNFGFTNRNFTTLTGSGNNLYSSSVYDAASGGLYRTDNLGLRWVHAGEPAFEENAHGSSASRSSCLVGAASRGSCATEQLLVMAAAPDNSKYLFAAGYHGMLESPDAGKSWTAGRNPPPGTKIGALLPLTSKEVLAGTDQGLFRTTDGASWTKLAEGRVDFLNRSGSNVVFALTSAGALVSQDEGVSWSRCGEPQSGTTWYGLAFDAMSPLMSATTSATTSASTSASTALAATSAGLFRSTDACHTWAPVRNGLRSETASLVLFHPTHAGEAFTSQGGRVFISSNGGVSWSALDDEAPGNSGPSSLFVLPAVPDTLFALFPRRGVFSTSIPTTTRAAGPAGSNSLNAQAEGAGARIKTFKEKTLQ
jgi:photosystem II stability/assembly factor-like uncharacterized protein